MFYLAYLIALFPAVLTAQFSLPGAEGPPDPVVSLSMEKSVFRPGESGTLRVLYRFPEGYHQTRDQGISFGLTPSSEKEGILFGSALYPEGVEEEGIVNYYDSVELTLEFFVAATLPEGEYPIGVEAHFQLCDDQGICYFPGSLPLESSIRVEGKPVGSRSLLSFLFLALIGGFLLNLMPCVLPLLSVKALNLMNQREGDKRSILLNALSYTAGILLSFLALAVVIILLKQSGQLLGWGFQFQSPYFLIVLISVLFLFSLSLFEVFLLIPPSGGLNKATVLSAKKGYAGSFFTGVFAVFVATPCTAPFLGAAIGFAFSQPPGVIVAILGATGVGFSLPFLLLGFFPGVFRFLPKPGKWMDKFREIMAFLLMGTAVYLSGTLLRQLGEHFSRFLWFILILGVVAWLWGWITRSVRKKIIRRSLSLLSLIFIAVSSSLLLRLPEQGTLGAPASSAGLPDSWRTFSPEQIQRLREEGETVFLAFSASWCTSCKINERTVLYTEKAEELFEENKVHLFKADLTSTNPPAMEWIYEYGRAGVPLYILFKPGEEPILLPEILSHGILSSFIAGNS